MRRRPFALPSISLLGVVLVLGVVFPASPGTFLVPLAQPTPFPTPTAGEGGRILYTVQEGDSLYRIAAVAGLTVEQLLALNPTIEIDTVLITGRTQLLLGYVAPTDLPTAEVFGPTATPPPPTPSSGAGEICVLLFLDSNGNAQLDDTEEPLAGGQVSIAEVSGVVAREITTSEDIERTEFDDPIGHCFPDLEDGDYNISVAAPVDYNPTTAMNIPIRLEAGDAKYVQFGAQPSSAIGGQPVQGGEQGSWMLGALGAVMLLAAAGLAFQASRLIRREREPPAS